MRAWIFPSFWVSIIAALWIGGLTATGLKGVANQEERGVMWRYFVEKVAAHPYGVAAHWFQYNDQFCLAGMTGKIIRLAWWMYVCSPIRS